MSTLYAPVDTLWSRVVARIERTSAGCWLWQGALNSQGYGCICSGRRSKSALVHHIAVAADGRPVPDGMTVDHQCHNGDRSCPGGTICLHRRCVNPAHLAIVTVGDNQRARFADGLCRKGHALSTRKDGKRFCRTCATDYSRGWAKALTADPTPPLEAVMLVALWALSVVAAVVIVGTDPETWRAADRMIDDAPRAES